MSELPSHDAILRAVGGALSKWSLVELQLSSLFSALSDIPPQVIDGVLKSTAMFDTIRDFRARVRVCDSLMRFEDVDELEMATWFRLSTDLTDGYEKRHQLAHFSVDYDAQERAVITPFLTASKVFAEDKVHLALENVRERSQEFTELYLAIRWFLWLALARRKLPISALQQSEEPQLVRLLRRRAAQSLADKRRQPRSSRA